MTVQWWQQVQEGEITFPNWNQIGEEFFCRNILFCEDGVSFPRAWLQWSHTIHLYVQYYPQISSYWVPLWAYNVNFGVIWRQVRCQVRGKPIRVQVFCKGRMLFNYSQSLVSASSYGLTSFNWKGPLCNEKPETSA